MEPHTIQQLTFGSIFFGGGVVGLLAATLISSYRNRKLSIALEIESNPILRPKLGSSSLIARVVIPDRSGEKIFDNLFVTSIRIQNIGNKDMEQFSFGVTFAEGDQVVYVEANGDDRHHTIKQHSDISPSNTAKEIDFTCTPFNRGDSYALSLFIVAPKDRASPELPRVSSVHSVRWVDIRASSILENVYPLLSVSLGPLSLHTTPYGRARYGKKRTSSEDLSR